MTVSTDFLLCLLTAALVVVTAVLAWVTNELAKSTKQMAEDALKTGEINRRALLIDKRPVVTVQQFEYDFDAKAGRLIVVNEGSTDGTITTSGLTIRLLRFLPQLHPFMEYNTESPAPNALPVGKVLSAGLPYIWEFNDSEENLSKDPEGSADIYILGFIHYTDTLGLLHQMKFCRKFDRNVSRFLPVTGDPDYDHST